MLSIDAIAQFYPPGQQVQKRNMLREYLQHKILQAIFESEYATKLSFLGGTALRIVYGNPRFSEDLDFDNFGMTEEDFMGTSEVVKKALEREGYEVELRTVHRGGYRSYVRLPKVLFENALSPLPEEKILIQLDTAAHGFSYVPVNKEVIKFDVLAFVPTTPPDIIFSQKIYAVFNRPRTLGRDFFDLTFIMSLGAKPNYEYLDFKLGIKSADELKGRVNEKIKELDFEQLADDVAPFVFNPGDLKRVTSFATLFQSAQL